MRVHQTRYAVRMRTLYVSFVAVLMSCATVPRVPDAPRDPGAPYHVTVITPSARCSGVHVAPAAVLTAAHCLDLDDHRAAVLPAQGEAVVVVGVDLVGSADVALLVLQAPLPGRAAPFGRAALPGDSVRTRGNCAPAAKALTVGGAMHGLLIATGTPNVCPGDSGGGWYDRAGRLVGITSSRNAGPVPQSSAVDVVRLGLEGLLNPRPAVRAPAR